MNNSANGILWHLDERLLPLSNIEDPMAQNFTLLSNQTLSDPGPGDMPVGVATSLTYDGNGDFSSRTKVLS